ncbi:MAG: hypothetical protein U0324_29325 [Polyangiales bacterium]
MEAPRRPTVRDLIRALGFPPETPEPERSPLPPDGPQFDAAVELLRGADDADVMARRRGGA